MHYNYIIIGAGPAGLQLGYFFEKNKENYIILERNCDVGSFFKTYPKQRNLISINKKTIFPVIKNKLRHDWNSLINEDEFLLKSDDFYPKADDYVEYLSEFQKKYNIKVKFNCLIDKIDKYDLKRDNKDGFIINDTENNSYSCCKLFMATGVGARPIPKNIYTGITCIDDECKIIDYSNMDLNLDLYKNKSVVIIGTGNAAFETANYLNPVVESINMFGNPKTAWQTHYPGNLRSINLPFLDTFFLKQGNSIWTTDCLKDKNNITILNIHLKILAKFLSASGSKISYIIWCGGFEPNYSLLNFDLKLKSGNFPVLKSTYESVSQPNLYFIGTLMQERDYKQGTSSFIHGFRYDIEFLYKHLTNNIEYTEIIGSENLIKYIENRFNESSVLYHRLNSFKDIVVLKNNKKGNEIFWYYNDIYTPYGNEFILNKGVTSLELNIEFGKPRFEEITDHSTLFSNARFPIPPFTHVRYKIHSSETNKYKEIHGSETPTSELNVPEIHYIYIPYMVECMINELSEKSIDNFEKGIIEKIYKFYREITPNEYDIAPKEFYISPLFDMKNPLL
mgnify:FL=1|tara:strand:+ start:388 stop:2079 length:1692 start_codon:yes stop_codon:yes gene_type:complete